MMVETEAFLYDIRPTLALGAPFSRRRVLEEGYRYGMICTVAIAVAQFGVLRHAFFS